jgi:hypothetical protein
MLYSRQKSSFERSRVDGLFDGNGLNHRIGRQGGEPNLAQRNTTASFNFIDALWELFDSPTIMISALYRLAGTLPVSFHSAPRSRRLRPSALLHPVPESFEAGGGLP